MKKTTFILLTLFILVTLLVLPTSSAYAQGPNPGNGGQVLFGKSFTLAAGDTFEGDLVVFGGNVTIEEDAHLNGNLVVIGGTIKSNGEIKGDVVVVGGQVNLEQAAHAAPDYGAQHQAEDDAEEDHRAARLTTLVTLAGAMPVVLRYRAGPARAPRPGDRP